MASKFNKMNRYHLYLLLHSGASAWYSEFRIEAKSLRTDAHGYYVFYGEDDLPIAYYPIINTVIAKIERSEQAEWSS